MTKPPEFDPHNPTDIPPAAEQQPWKDDEDEIPSFEGMVFSSYVDPADLSGDRWESTQPLPEMPSTVWEEPPLTEDEVLRAIATSSPNSTPAERSPDAPQEYEPGQDDAVEPDDKASNWLVTPHVFAENLPIVGHDPLNVSQRGLYGSLADSSWLALEKLRPVQGLPGAEYVAQTPFYTEDILEQSLAGQAAAHQETAHHDPAHHDPARAAQAAEEKPHAALLSAGAKPSLAEPSNPASLAPVISAAVSGQDTQPALMDSVIPIRSERPLFHSWYEPEAETAEPTRIPNFGHLLLVALVGFIGVLGAILLMRGALDLHLFGVSTVEKASSDIHYTIGFMGSMYLISFGLAWFIFPHVWHKPLFAGLQWNFVGAWRHFWFLLGAAFACFVLAMADEILLPGPANAPIDKLFDSRTAAWLLFAFGVTFAPFFEETLFRGFILPALCTAFDWYGEKLTGNTPRPIDTGDHPQWSLFAMILGSIATSIPFALMHAEQTAWSLGPFLLLVAVSLVLCWARLATRSLAASVLVHSSYNLLLFSLMLLGTGGFRNLDKM